MRKNEKGVLAVETSIVLTFCVLLILFLFSFARVYSAQSTVSHAVIQASDAVALESYLRETCFNASEEDVVKLANRITGAASLSSDSFISLREADVATIAKEKFTYAIAQTKEAADNKLKQLGVKNGLAGVDLSASTMELGNDDVIVYATYTIQMQFPVLGLKDIVVTKAARSKTFGDILFGIETLSQDPNMGSASGGGNYKHGTQVQITATPKYGYEFVGWLDGSSANPRTVTVNGAATYVAAFRARDFGVNFEINPAEGGSATGGGTFKYLESTNISAVPAEGYSFKNWEIYRHEDKTTTTVDSNETPITVNQTYTCTANFKINSYTVNVVSEGAGCTPEIIYNGVSKTSVTAKYKTSLKLSAPNLPNYEFLGWKEQGSSNCFNKNNSVNITIPAKNVTYVACYKKLTCDVHFLGPNNELLKTIVVNKDQTFSEQGLTVPSYTVVGDKVFGGWRDFSKDIRIVETTKVYGNWGNLSISINGGAQTNVGATTLTATTYPAGAKVTWRSYDGSKVYVDSNGRITATGKGSATIQATVEYYGLTASDSVSVKVGESEFELVYCMNMGSQIRYYTKEHISLVGVSRWGAYFPGSNHHCYTAQSYARRIVKYSDTLYPRAWKVSADPNTYQRVGGYSGYNKSGVEGFVLDNGTGNALYFVNRQVSGPPGLGYYISKISY